MHYPMEQNEMHYPIYPAACDSAYINSTQRCKGAKFAKDFLKSKTRLFGHGHAHGYEKDWFSFHKKSLRT